ncbi:MAG: hypothetical protein WBF06_10020 [Candidatus Acidiferrales bacterium]
MNRFLLSGCALLSAVSFAVLAAGAQNAPQTTPAAEPQSNASASPAPQEPAALNASDAVPDGTHFLVRLNDALNTGKDAPGRKFTVTIIEPLETSGGSVLPPGSKITGHISRVESASVTGRARLWLTFDDIHAPGGREPIVAEVSSVPDDGNVRPGPGKEGEVEAVHSSAARQAEVSAAGAAVGAAVGGAAGGGRGVAEGAIAGGAIAFLASRHYAQEIEMPKGTRIELVLDRPLYITQP